MAVVVPRPHSDFSAFSSYETNIQRAVLGRDQDAFSEKSGKFIRPYMPEQHMEFFGTLSLVYAGVSDASGQPAALVLVGEPGFIRPLSPTTLTVRPRQQLSPDLFKEHARIGFLGMEAQTRRRNRLNARVQHLDVDTNTLTLAVLQSYGNCPKYIQARHIKVVPEGAQQATCASVSTSLNTVRTGPLSQEARTIIEASDCIFIATHLRLEDNGGRNEAVVGADVSHRGGPPGFVRVTDDSRLSWGDYIGNYFFQTLGNIAANGQACVLFIDYMTGTTLQVLGHAWVDMDDTSLPGAQRVVNVDVKSWRYIPQGLPIRQEGQTSASPYNPVSGNAADRRYVKCVRIEDAALGIKTFHFSYPEPAGIGKAEPFQYQAGQYASFDFQVGDKLHNRTWTISSHPDETAVSGHFSISVKKAGLISTLLHEQLSTGSAVMWRGAAGEFVPELGTTPVLLVAGGIGITPMRPFLMEFAKQGRPAALLYSVRSAAEVAYLPQLQTLEAESAGSVRVLINVTQKDSSWKGHIGRIDASYLSAKVPDLLDFSDAYMCGPVPFMDGMEAVLTSLGFPGGRIHSESFAF